MPIPRFQPAGNKRLKISKPTITTGPSLDSLDDYCLSKIIGHALTTNSSSDEWPEIVDTQSVERNLSLVSRRWYWLTQAQVGTHGIHRINLNKLVRAKKQTRNGGLRQESRVHNVDLFRLVQPSLLKYKNIQLEGPLTCDEFRKLVVAFDAARVERLTLKINIEKDGTLAKDFANIPKQLDYLKELTLLWCNDSRNDYSNGLTWTVYTRATSLKTLELYLTETHVDSFDEPSAQKFSRGDSICKMSSLFATNLGQRAQNSLDRLVFRRSSNESLPTCSFTSLVKSTLAKENRLSRVDTNDTAVIEYLIKSSNRICTALELKSLRLLSPIKNIDLLKELLSSRTLGTNFLSIVIDNIDQIEEVRHSMEVFNPMRSGNAVCHLSLHLRDQKFSDCEDKIKHLVHLSRLARVIMHVTTMQRVSIDCCHLMWSIGRALQSTDMPGECLFKIAIQQSGSQAIGIGNKQPGNLCEITIPFGGLQHHKINPNVEDVVRHREIIKAVKRDCYNSFVKSVRDIVSPR